MWTIWMDVDNLYVLSTYVAHLYFVATQVYTNTITSKWAQNISIWPNHLFFLSYDVNQWLRNCLACCSEVFNIFEGISRLLFKPVLRSEVQVGFDQNRVWPGCMFSVTYTWCRSSSPSYTLGGFYDGKTSEILLYMHLQTYPKMFECSPCFWHLVLLFRNAPVLFLLVTQCWFYTPLLCTDSEIRRQCLRDDNISASVKLFSLGNHSTGPLIKHIFFFLHMTEKYYNIKDTSCDQSIKITLYTL